MSLEPTHTDTVLFSPFWQRDALVPAVAEQNKNTIVVIQAVGLLIFESWIDHPNVTAVCIHFCLCFLPLNHSDRHFS
jgi:hypothetical protein